MKLLKILLLLASLFFYPSVSPMQPDDGAIKTLADTLGDMNLYDDGDLSVLPQDLWLQHIFTIRHCQYPWQDIGWILEFRTVCKRWYLTLIDINVIAQMLHILPLHFAAALGRSDEIIKLTLEGASLLEPDDEGFRAAHYAIGRRKDHAMKILQVANALGTSLQAGRDLLLVVERDGQEHFYSLGFSAPSAFRERDFIDVMKRNETDELIKMLDNDRSILLRPSFFKSVESTSNQECIDLVKYVTIGRLQYKFFELLCKKEKVPKKYFQHLKSLSANLNIYDEEGHTLLGLASKRARHIPAFQELLAYEAIDVNLGDKKDGSTPLMKAASSGYKTRVKALLAAEGCDVNRIDHSGHGPLHCLVRDDSNIDLLEQFLNMPDCDIEIQCLSCRSTPLFHAVCHDQIGCMKLLINKKANIMAESIHGRTLLHMAACNGSKRCLQELLKCLQHSVNSKDKQGGSPLRMSAYYGHADCIELLINAGAVVDIKDNNGEAPLHYAATGGEVACIELLCRHDADINCVSNAGNISTEGIHYGLYTPLHYAAHRGRFEVVKMLVTCGADVTLKTQLGKTALDLACEYGHQEIIDFLESTKASMG